MPSGSHDDRNIFLMTSSSIDIGMTPSLALKFRLTDWGKSVYGTYDMIGKNGMIIGIVNTIYSFIKTGSPPTKDHTFDEVLWEGDSALMMSGEITRVHGLYITYSSDLDNDGYINIDDDFPLDGAAYLDTDGDGMPDELYGNSTTGLIEDQDDDNDGVPDVDDEYPKDPDRGGEKDSKAEFGSVLMWVGIGIIGLVVILFLLVWFNREDEGKSWGVDEE
jgi:hypothetical protein